MKHVTHYLKYEVIKHCHGITWIQKQQKHKNCTTQHIKIEDTVPVSFYRPQNPKKLPWDQTKPPVRNEQVCLIIQLVLHIHIHLPST
jgi:hypothetical protein